MGGQTGVETDGTPGRAPALALLTRMVTTAKPRRNERVERNCGSMRCSLLDPGSTSTSGAARQRVGSQAGEPTRARYLLVISVECSEEGVCGIW